MFWCLHASLSSQKLLAILKGNGNNTDMLTGIKKVTDKMLTRTDSAKGLVAGRQRVLRGWPRAGKRLSKARDRLTRAEQLQELPLEPSFRNQSHELETNNFRRCCEAFSEQAALFYHVHPEGIGAQAGWGLCGVVQVRENIIVF